MLKMINFFKRIIYRKLNKRTNLEKIKIRKPI